MLSDLNRFLMIRISLIVLVCLLSLVNLAPSAEAGQVYDALKNIGGGMLKIMAQSSVLLSNPAQMEAFIRVIFFFLFMAVIYVALGRVGLFDNHNNARLVVALGISLLGAMLIPSDGIFALGTVYSFLLLLAAFFVAIIAVIIAIYSFPNNADPDTQTAYNWIKAVTFIILALILFWADGIFFRLCQGMTLSTPYAWCTMFQP